MYLPDGYKTSRQVTYLDTEHGPGRVKQTEHFDGSVDAAVKVKSLKLSLTQGADPSPVHVAAILELQEATRQLKWARHTNDQRLVDVSVRRIEEANQRLLQVQ